MLKNLLLGASLLVTMANISPIQAQTTVISKAKSKVKTLKGQAGTTLTQLTSKHTKPHSLDAISSVISDAALEKENSTHLDNAKSSQNSKEGIWNKIGFFNSFFGGNTEKSQLGSPIAKKSGVAPTLFKNDDRADPVQSTTSAPKADTDKILTKPLSEKLLIRATVLHAKTQYSPPWAMQLKPSQIKELEKASKKTATSVIPTMDLSPALDLSPPTNVPEASVEATKSSKAPPLPPRPRKPTNVDIVDTTPSPTMDLSPLSDVPVEIKLNAPPPPPMPPSGATVISTNVPQNLESTLSQPPAKMDKVNALTEDKTDERSDLLSAIRKGKTLKKVKQESGSSTALSDEDPISRIDETIVNTSSSTNSEEVQNSGLFAGLFKTVGNFFSSKTAKTLDDTGLNFQKGARLKDYSITYKHTVDDGFSEMTYDLYFTGEDAKNSYIERIKAFADSEDEMEFAESYFASPAQTHIRQLQEKRIIELKKLEEKSVEDMKRAQAATKVAGEGKQETITLTKVDVKLVQAAATEKTLSENPEDLTSKPLLVPTALQTKPVADGLLDSIKGFTLTALKKVTGVFKRAEKPKNEMENHMISRRSQMGYNDKDDLDWD